MIRFADIWRPAIVRCSMQELIARGSIAGLPLHWLPEQPSLQFLADPFGLWHEAILHVFVEAYDYRDRHGFIDVLRFDAGLELLDRRTCLREPWHLSYPFVFEAEGAIWMLPEAHRSGTLHLYRARAFPGGWERAASFALDTPAIDPSPVFHHGLWWLLYSPTGDRRAKVGRLHVAFAERIEGPWHPHPGNPVRSDMSSARPGGTPLVIDGVIHAPMQDCTRTYGGGIRILRIHKLTPSVFEAEAGPLWEAPGALRPYHRGFHTLSACGDITLIDVKRFSRSPKRPLMAIGRVASNLIRGHPAGR